MHISLNNVGKRFNRHWLFKQLSFEFTSGNTYALLGPNGSGKSTLLQIIYGVQNTSEGSISYTSQKEEAITTDTIYKYTGFAAPALELIEDFTLSELLRFHFKFRPLHPKLNLNDIPNILSLTNAKEVYLKNFSSGMRQRVKLALALLSDSPLLLLDEPCTNLDNQGIALYEQLVQEYATDRTIIVASNQPYEYTFCKEQLSIEDFRGN